VVGGWYTRAVLGVIAAITLAALYGPLAVMSFFSFFTKKAGAVQWDSFTFDWYVKLAGNSNILSTLVNSLMVGFASVFCALVLGTVFAIYYNGSRSRFRNLPQILIFLPFLLPPIITGLSLLIFFYELGVPRSLITVAFGHTIFVLALCYRVILSRLQALSQNILEASYDLGANRRQTFFYVLMPNILTAMVTAAVLAFALSFDETLISLFLFGEEMTLPVRLWTMMVRLGITPEVNALVTLILLVSAGLFLAVARMLRQEVGQA
jgi:ABC-type spermidine/putrescine transport system permease subunit II